MSFESIREEDDEMSEEVDLPRRLPRKKKTRAFVKESALLKYSAKLKRKAQQTPPAATVAPIPLITQIVTPQKKVVRKVGLVRAQIPPVIEGKNEATSRAQCLKMCTESEARLREETYDLSIFEKSKHAPSKVAVRLAVKKYARSAADRIMDDPATIRPPGILEQTVRYLVECVLDADSEGHSEYYFRPKTDVHSLEDILPFMLDRLRAV